MQNIVMYSTANTTLGVVRDYANARSATPPIFTRGFSVLLKIRLFTVQDSDEQYPIEAFSAISSWQCVFDVDYNQATGPIIVADNADIYVHEVTDDTEESDSSSYVETRKFTEVVIPISNMNTEELVTLLGNNESVSNLNMELVGFDGNADEVFGLQIKGFTVRNRIYYGGNPTEIPVDYLTASQARALVAAGVVLQFSADGLNWHDVQSVNSDLYFRVRSASDSSATWSSPIGLAKGAAGNDGVTPSIDASTKHWMIGSTDTGVKAEGEEGESSYLYQAYASDSSGSNFSLTPTNSLKYTAMFISSTYIAWPSLSDFTAAGAVWVKYIGDDGTGTGDMLKSVYDTNNDGKVDSAAHADTADEASAVAWDDVTDKPTSFAPISHTHDQQDINNSARKPSDTQTSANVLQLSYPVKMVNNGTGSSLTIAITDVRDDLGNVVNFSNGYYYAWEYHVRAIMDITTINIGSSACTMKSVDIPSTLPAINAHATFHVFSICGIYDQGAVNNKLFHVRYLYSYSAYV